MTFNGLVSKDFDIFSIPGLEERMSGIKDRVRPKLEVLGESLAPSLTEMTGQDMFVHVAKHARRTVNPPDDTWVAWAPNKRGYKKLPHFQTGLWETHLFAWFALIYESPHKPDFAKRALSEVEAIQATIPDNFVWSTDHTRPEVVSNKGLSTQKLTDMLQRLQKVKKAELLCGINIDRNDPLLQDGQALQNKIQTTFETLLPLYRLAQEA